MENSDHVEVGTFFTKTLLSRLVSSFIEKKLDCDCQVELKSLKAGHFESGNYGVDVDATVSLSIPPEKVKELLDNLL